MTREQRIREAIRLLEKATGRKVVLEESNRSTREFTRPIYTFDYLNDDGQRFTVEYIIIPAHMATMEDPGNDMEVEVRSIKDYRGNEVDLAENMEQEIQTMAEKHAEEHDGNEADQWD